MSLIFSAWLLWCALQVLLLLLAPLFASMLGMGACTNGLWISIPASVREKLTEEELLAVIAHEHGHRVHGHVFENLALACLFIRRNPKRAWQQELEADDYAADMGHAKGLALALSKLSRSNSGLVRIKRLLDRTL
jgi:Peptidase family M48